MIKKIFFSLIIIFNLIYINNVYAAEHKIFIGPKTKQEFQQEQEQLKIEQQPIKAIIGGDKNVIVNRQILFTAEQSLGLRKGLTYIWDFGDGTKEKGLTVSHTYKTTGAYRVSLQIYEGKNKLDQDEIIVTVTKDIIILITDNNTESTIENLKKIAGSQGNLLLVVKSINNNNDYFASRNLRTKLLNIQSEIKQSKTIIFWTKSNIGLNTFLDIYQPLSKNGDQTLFLNKTFIKIINSNFITKSSFYQAFLKIFKPKYLLIAPEAALNKIVSTTNISKLLISLKNSNIKYKLYGLHSQRDLDKLNITNFLSFSINYLVNTGVPIYNIYMLLLIPIITTLITIARQIIGIKTFGLYTPLLITFAFLFLGIIYGLLLFAIIMTIGTLTRLFLKKLRFLYIPRMSILLIIVSLSILFVYVIGIYLGSQRLINISILPILLLIILSENFVSAQMEKGTKNAISLTLQTLGISIIVYFIITLPVIKDFILGFPEIIFISLLINIILGRWTGLRILEYYRFRNLLK